MLKVSQKNYRHLSPQTLYPKFSLFPAIKDYLFSYSIGEYIFFKYSEDLRSKIEENRDKYFVSFCINNTNYQYPIAFEKQNLYHNIISYLETNFGYKTGRMMEIYQRNHTKYEEGSTLELNIVPQYPNIAFIQVFYMDTARYNKFYQEYRDLYTVEELLSIPLQIFGKPYNSNSIKIRNKTD